MRLDRIGSNGVGLALLAALLFGASAPAAKALLPRVAPQLLAGLLYLGSGSGLLLYWTVSNVLTLGQQWWLYRRYDTQHPPKVVEATASRAR